MSTGLSSQAQLEEVLVSQSCPTLCNPEDCSLPGSSVHGILQARILEWVAIPFSRGIFPTQELNLGLLQGKLILHHLILRGSPQLDSTLYLFIYLFIYF